MTLDCVVEFVLFVREDGFTALRAAAPDGALLTAVGTELAGARPGEGLRLTGRWTEHRRHGARFAVESCQRQPPAGVPAIRRYLGSGLVRGVGPLLAQAITDRFGERTLDVIDRDPARLAEVYGIGERRTRRITESWQAQKIIKELMVVLRSVGVSPLLAEPIHRVYGEDCLKAVAHDPYKMVGEVDGIGFPAADRIALSNGGALDSPARMEAAVWEICSVRARRAGHCYLPAEEAISGAVALVEQERALLSEAAGRLTVGRGAPLTAEEHPVTGQPLLAPRALRRAENRLARALAELAAAESDLPAAAYRLRGVRRGAACRAARGRAHGPDAPGLRAHRRTGLRQVPHRARDRRTGARRRRQRHAGRAHRQSRPAPGRTDRRAHDDRAPPGHPRL